MDAETILEIPYRKKMDIKKLHPFGMQHYF